ncbi:MAG: glycosyltransferase family 2 protein [Chloroflexi bacterium]|nr:glycosyltransferase family 2 protein [Chloroflexota bacterium]
MAQGSSHQTRASRLGNGDSSTRTIRLSVLIPVYNERDTIEEVIRRVEAVDLPKEIVVVDDCSKDGSREILRGLNRPGVRVLFHPENRGKGAAIQTALAEATGDYVIIQDADLEYDPQEYHKLLAPIKAGVAEIVYGSRFLGRHKRMSLTQALGNRFLTLVTNFLYATSLSDMETCFKLVPTPILKSLKLRSRAFDFEPEVTAKLLKRGHRILEVPITYAARDEDEGKKISWKDGFPALKCLIRYRFTD